MQEQKNNITDVIHIGGFVRLILAYPTSSLKSKTVVAGAAALLASLTGSLQLSESHKQCRYRKL